MFISSSRLHPAWALVVGLVLLLLPASPPASAAKQVFDVTGTWDGSAHNSTQSLEFVATLVGGHGKSITGMVTSNGVTFPIHGTISPTGAVKLQATERSTKIALSGHLDTQTVTITGTITITTHGKKGSGSFTMIRQNP